MAKPPISNEALTEAVKSAMANGPDIRMGTLGGTTEDNQEFDPYTPIRILRETARLAGARLKPVMSRAELEAEIERLGEPEPIVFADHLIKSTPTEYAASINGFNFEISVEGPFCFKSHGGNVELFTDALKQFTFMADEHFDNENDRLLGEESKRQSYFESVKDFDGTPPEPSEGQRRILELADSLGIRNCDITMAAIGVLQAYGLPLGERVDDGSPKGSHVMMTAEELEAKALKAMEKPL